MENLLLTNYQAPGDLLMLSAAIRDLHLAYPGRFRTEVRCSHPQIFQNSPYNQAVPRHTAHTTCRELEMHYPLLDRSRTAVECGYHFVHGFRKYLEGQLDVTIPLTACHGDVYLSVAETRPCPCLPDRYWILNAGWKNDFQVKPWPVRYYRELVERHPDQTFVQTGGGSASYNPLIGGSNVIDLVGRTTLRQFFRIMHHAAGVVTGVSFPMHAAAAVPVPDSWQRKCRPCIVIAGGRETDMWTAYSGHRVLSVTGTRSCCLNGGCWKWSLEPDAGDNGCVCPVEVGGQTVAACMTDISVDRVSECFKQYEKVA